MHWNAKTSKYRRQTNYQHLASQSALLHTFPSMRITKKVVNNCINCKKLISLKALKSLCHQKSHPQWEWP